MKFLLSIFSSESLDLRGLRPWGMATCFVLLGVVEFGFARRESLWSRFPKSPSGIVDVLEQEVIAKARDPVIIILGDSRSRDAVLPTVLEQELGLRRTNVLNLSLTAGDPFDSYVLYRRNRAQFRKAKLLLLALEDWHLKDDRAIPERYRRFATLEDRMSFADRRQVLPLLVGWLWRTLDARKPLGRLIKETVLRRDRSAPIDDEGRVVWRTNDPEVGPETVDMRDDLNRAYSGFKPEEMEQSGALGHVRRILDMAAEDGLEVVMICPPFRSAFIDARREMFQQQWASNEKEQSTLEEVFQKALHELAAHYQHVRVYVVLRARDLNIPDTCFIDYGHMLRRGAELYSQTLAQWLRKQYPSLLSQ